MGKMEVACSDCGALHWACETLVGSPKFSTCCHSGKIKIPKLDDPPPELLHLLSGQENICKNFHDHIRNYNNALAMTSLGCNQDMEINRDGGGSFVFRVQGHLYHQTGSLLPQPGSSHVYAQLYIYDPQEALEFHMNNAANTSLDRTTMQTLQDMLYRRHPGVQLYKQAFELTQHMNQLTIDQNSIQSSAVVQRLPAQWRNNTPPQTPPPIPTTPIPRRKPPHSLQKIAKFTSPEHERIAPFTTLPWCRSSSLFPNRFSTNPCTQTTDSIKACEDHIQLIKTYQSNPNTLYIYTDGSKINKAGFFRIGAAAVAYHENREVACDKMGLGGHAEVFDAEMAALAIGASKARELMLT